MKTIEMIDKPAVFPESQVGGDALKPLTKVLLDRRATSHFKPDPVPEEYLNAILTLAGQAPSGYNLQPWRFIVVRDEANRKRLRSAAFNQPKVAEAPVVVIAFSHEEAWRENQEAVVDEMVRRGASKGADAESLNNTINGFMKKMPADIWLNRHTMIAFTTMMLVAESFGFDTAPMEGFDPEAVKREFGIPHDAQVVALLAIGFGAKPEKPYPGRLSLEEIVSHEHFEGNPK